MNRHVVDVDGAAIVARTWGDGPPVVLIHGAAGSWNHWIRNVDTLAEHHLVIGVDLPGYGESDLIPDVQCRVITGAGHWSPYEAPGQINAAIQILGSSPPS